MDIIQKQNIGNAGEYYIAARLSALDYTVTITLGRAERYDILALSPKGKLVKISVKTTQRLNAKSFPLSSKDESDASEDFYYAFIKLNDFSVEPDFWIIPSEIVCPIVKESHDLWLNTPGIKGQRHGTTSLRQFFVDSKNSLYQEEIDKYYKNIHQFYKI